MTKSLAVFLCCLAGLLAYATCNHHNTAGLELFRSSTQAVRPIHITASSGLGHPKSWAPNPPLKVSQLSGHSAEELPQSQVASSRHQWSSACRLLASWLVLTTTFVMGIKVFLTKQKKQDLLLPLGTDSAVFRPEIIMLSTGADVEAEEVEAATLKRRLLKILSSTAMGKDETSAAAVEIDTLISGLGPLQKSFDVSVADGEWLLNFTRNSNDAPKVQAAFSFQKGYQNFDVKQKTFRNIAELLGPNVSVVADVKYRPDPENSARLISEIVYAGFHLGPLKIPLPLRAVGWLEFIYLDSDLRITRGNRGGLFIHTRPPLDAEGRKALDDHLSKRPIVLDPSGYFVIRINRERQLIEAEHFPNTINEKGLACDPVTGQVLSCKTPSPKVDRVFTGRTAKELGVKVIEEPSPALVSKMDHVLYLGREFQRAEECLNSGKEYVQD